MEPIPSLRIIKYVFYEQFMLQREQEKRANPVTLQKIELVLSQLRRPQVKQKLIDTTFTVFDLETNGFFPRLGDEVISIGAIKMNMDQMKFQEHFYEVVKPIGEVPDYIYSLTGLDENQIKNGSLFPEAFLKFLDFSKDTILVAHPATFDVHFLQVLAKRWGMRRYQPSYINSYFIANYLHPNRNNRLDHLIDHYQIKSMKRHHALHDAEMTATIFKDLLEQLTEKNILTLWDYFNLSGKKKGVL